MGVVVERAQIESLCGNLRESKKLVFSNGCFDLLHVGHVRYLQNAKQFGDVLVVGINSDSSVRQLKGPSRPVQSENDRAEILAALAVVDFTVIFNEATPLQLIELVRPQVLVKGGDWQLKDIVGADLVLGWGGEVHSLKFVDGQSTSNLIARIR